MWRLLILTPTRAVLSLTVIWCFGSSMYFVSLTCNINGSRHMIASEPRGWLYSQNLDRFTGKNRFHSGPITDESPGISAALTELAKEVPEWEPTSQRYIRVNPGFVTFRSPNEYIFCIRHWLVVSVFAIFQFYLERKFRLASSEADQD